MQGIVDIHNHVLPGVDDGAGSVKEAADMCALAVEEGIRTIVATPHYHLGMQAAGNERRDNALQLLEEEIAIRCLNLRIYRGNEIYYSVQAVEDLRAGKARTMGSSQYVLTEFSPEAEYSLELSFWWRAENRIESAEKRNYTFYQYPHITLFLHL